MLSLIISNFHLQRYLKSLNDSAMYRNLPHRGFPLEEEETFNQSSRPPMWRFPIGGRTTCHWIDLKRFWKILQYCMLSEWFINLLRHHVLLTETFYKGDKTYKCINATYMWQKTMKIKTITNGGFYLKNKSFSLCKECSFCHVSDWLFVPNKKHLDHIYNSSVAWLSWRLVIPPGSPQQSIPFSSSGEEQPGLLGRI